MTILDTVQASTLSSFYLSILFWQVLRASGLSHSMFQPDRFLALPSSRNNTSTIYIEDNIIIHRISAHTELSGLTLTIFLRVTAHFCHCQILALPQSSSAQGRPKPLAVVGALALDQSLACKRCIASDSLQQGSCLN